MADKMVVMNNACIRQIGTPQEVYDKPASPFVADFVGSINFFSTDIRKTDAEGARYAYKLKAIRPENIKLLSNDSNEGFEVKVKEIEFHGPSYRLSLIINEDDKIKFSDDVVTIDIPSKKFISLGIKKQDKIRIMFEDDKLLLYNADMEGSILV